MHSQAELIQYLSTMRRLLVARHVEVGAGYAAAELCLCRAIEEATGDDSEHPMRVAVKQMIQAAFADDGQKYSKYRYIWPVAVATHAFRSETGFRGTVEQVAEGYTKRLALIDKWIADAHKKLLAAVFRKALDAVSKGGAEQYMCNELRRAAASLTGCEYGMGWGVEIAAAAQEVLDQYKPYELKHNVWFNTNERGRAVRKAILNLCVTEVTRGFK